MELQIYSVMYFGNAKKYQGLNQPILAYLKREAVERYYEQVLNDDYYPEDNLNYGGIVRDYDGNVIAEHGDESIEYDGGNFYAEKIVG